MQLPSKEAFSPVPMALNSNPGLSSQEIRALEDEIKLLKAYVASKDKQNQTLKISNKGLQD